MKIWVDADATPRPVKEMLYRAAERRGVRVILVANRWMHTPRHPNLEVVVVEQGFDVADAYIAERVEAGELVISADVPLAAQVVARGAVCVDPRGEVIDAANANARLAMRDFFETMRESGEQIGGPAPFGERDKRRFAAALDRWIVRQRGGG